MPSAKYERLYPEVPKKKASSIPLAELADGPIIGRSPAGAQRFKARLKKAPPVKREY